MRGTRTRGGHGPDAAHLLRPLRLSLGLRLGLMTAFIVTVVMALVSGAQLWLEDTLDGRERQAWMAASLAPLIEDLEEARSPREAVESFHAFHLAYLGQASAGHAIDLRDERGHVLAATAEVPQARQEELLSASVSFRAPGVTDGELFLSAYQEDSELAQATAIRLQGWVLHLLVTAAATVGMLLVLINRQVSRPVERLLEDIRKMELGYWDDVPDPGGAAELRWLALRFRGLGQELHKTTEHLVAAQRRGFAAEQGARVEPADPVPGSTATDGERASVADLSEAGAHLVKHAEKLESADPSDRDTMDLAAVAWDHLAPQAENLGLPTLRARLEDAALAVLMPDEFREIADQLLAHGQEFEARALQYCSTVLSAVESRDVPLVDLTWRIKHVAGAWKKMEDKSLRLDQVHDLIGLRIVVPTETDCYHVLAVLHDLFDPVVARFKDYIVAPKSNGYRSLHASLRDGDGRVLEVQIRSSAMHRHAEHGRSSHNYYKAGTHGRAARLRWPYRKR